MWDAAEKQRFDTLVAGFNRAAPFRATIRERARTPESDVFNILVTTDGSQPSRSVLPHAARLAAACGGRIMLMRVLNPQIDLAREFAGDVETAVGRLSAAWQAELEPALAAAGGEASALVAVQQHGEDVHDAIIRVAAEQQATMIAMHSRGSGALRHALLGSVAMGVLGNSAMPVLLTGQQADPNPGTGPYRIVMTSDGSPASLDVVQVMAPVLEAGAVAVTLVRICEPRSGRAGPEAEQAACLHQLESVRQMLPAAVACDCQCPAAAYEQPVAEAIIEAAGAASADAIAMSTHGHGALRHLLAGSVALDVLERSPLPVILVRGRG